MRNQNDRDEIDVSETVWIPMSDGIQLAARTWIPKSAVSDPVPAILEYTPYRRRDGSRDRDDQVHPHLAAHGYACVRLDIRGTGDSEGIIRDEYLQQELDDAVEAIAWIARQPWCNSRVGMMGISWGGFNSLQVAALRPPALKAIVTLCSTDDRYADDMHYMGGAQITGNLEWGSTFFSMMARAPDPLVVGDRWRSMWMQRLEAVTPMVATSLAHQRRDAYWRHGSVCENIGAIKVPVMAVGGWADGYTNAIFRLLRDLTSPRLGIVGPWGHKYPHLGVPGPAIGFLTEMLRWWDRWLKDIDTGIAREPMLRAYIEDWIPPSSHYAARPGRWVAEESWPSGNVETRRLFLNGNGLEAAAKPGATRTISSPLTIGAAGGEWCAYSLGGIGPELPLDQRQDDSYSLVFDGEPLAAPLEVLGAPMLEIEASSDRPLLQLVARLNDVSPDGEIARVSFGVLNLSHRDGHTHPRALEPGRRCTVRVQLNAAGHRFAKGHRIRVALSTSYWPMVWPSPERGTLSIIPGSSTLELPVRKPATGNERLPSNPRNRRCPPSAACCARGMRIGALSTSIGTAFERVEVLRDDGRSVIEDIGVETGFARRCAIESIRAMPRAHAPKPIMSSSIVTTRHGITRIEYAIRHCLHRRRVHRGSRPGGLRGRAPRVLAQLDAADRARFHLKRGRHRPGLPRE